LENLRKDPSNVNEKLDKFAKSSAKSYAKATILIGKEFEPIRNGLIKLRRISVDFEKNNGELVKKKDKIATLLRKNEEKKDNERIHSNILNEIKEEEKNYSNNKNELEKIENKINKLKGSSKYKKLERLEEEKINKQKSLREIELNVNDLINQRILRKYAYLELENSIKELVQKYVENPTNALLSDLDLKIVDIFKDIKEKIKNKEIKDKNSNKLIAKLNVEKEVFLNYRDRIESINKEIARLDEIINKNKINFDEVFEERKIIQDRIKNNERHLETLRKRKIGVEKIISHLNMELTENIRILNFI